MKRFLSIILAIILACAGTFDTVLANEAAASDELPEGTKSVTVSYDRAAAVAYARRFANVDNNGIFKSMGLDCTNFVSQCMWSGYGGTKGYSLDDTAALKARVAADYRQTSTWYGRNADSPYQYGSGAFIRVVDFWDYVTTNTGYGPRATGYNNNKVWTQLTVVPRTGDILQVYSSSQGRYVHSVIVTQVKSTSLTVNNKDMWRNNIIVSQHTPKDLNRPLGDLVGSYGDANCKIRLIRPKSATFSK